MTHQLVALALGGAAATIVFVALERASLRRGWRPGGHAPLWRGGWTVITLLVAALLALASPTLGGQAAEALATAASVTSAVVDVRTRRVPRPLVDALAVGEVLVVRVGAADPVRVVIAAIVGGLATWLAWWGIARLSRGGLGAGDVALLAALGAAEAPLGWWVPILGGLGTLLVGSLLGGVHLVRGGRLKDRLPFAPAIAVAGLVALGFGDIAHAAHVAASLA